MREEEAMDGAVEDDNLHAFVGFERRNDLIQLRDALRPEYVERRMVERDLPIGWQAPFEADLSLFGRFSHSRLLRVAASDWLTETGRRIPHSRAYGTPRMPVSFRWRCP